MPWYFARWVLLAGAVTSMAKEGGWLSEHFVFRASSCRSQILILTRLCPLGCSWCLGCLGCLWCLWSYDAYGAFGAPVELMMFVLSCPSCHSYLRVANPRWPNAAISFCRSCLHGAERLCMTGEYADCLMCCMYVLSTTCYLET